MKTLPSGMQNDLDGGVTTHAHAYLLTRKDGVMMGFTSHDRPLSFAGTTFEPDAGYTPSAFEHTTGLNVDGIEAFGFIQSDRISDDDIVAGKYDDAEVVVYRVDWTDVNKRAVIFRGHIGNVSYGRVAFIAEVRSLAHKLNQPSGRVYLYTCDVKLFSKRCGVSETGTSPDGHPYKVTGSDVDAIVEPRRAFKAATSSLSGVPEGWFNRGVLTFTSGNNDTFKAEIKIHQVQGSDAVLYIWEPMPFDIQVGDTFDILAGCDKTIETCKAKFDNVLNFQGFPRMPNQDHVLVFAHKDSKNDGGSLFRE